jgi:quercetin dioxygenase-like cupin family protein
MNFTKNADTSALQIESIEGKAMVGALLIKPLIQGEQMSLMETQVAAGVAAPPHTHDHESLIYVVRGLLKTVVGDNSFVLGPGDVCRHPRNVSHFIEALEDSTFVEVKSPAPDFTRLYGTRDGKLSTHVAARPEGTAASWCPSQASDSHH